MKKIFIACFVASVICGCSTTPESNTAATLSYEMSQIVPNQVNEQRIDNDIPLPTEFTKKQVAMPSGTLEGTKSSVQDSSWPTEIGMATYYATEMEGRTTASGEPYDPEQLTAAHRTIPFGSSVRVTNLKTNQQVVVRINDRWGGGGDRIINLSKQAANQLNFGASGIVRVRLDVESLSAASALHSSSVQQLPVRLESDSDSKKHSRSKICENEADILGLTGEFFRNHVTACLSRRQ